MNKEELQKTLIKLFYNYQKEIKSLNYGEFTKATYFLLEKLKKYQGISEETDQFLKIIYQNIELIKQQFSLEIDMEVQNEMRKGR